MEQRLQISVSKGKPVDGTVACRQMSLREKFLQYLFGSRQRMAIIIPGHCVREISIQEISEGGHYER